MSDESWYMIAVNVIYWLLKKAPTKNKAKWINQGKKQLSKSSMSVLFVDDEPFPIVKILKDQGWSNVKRIKDVVNLDIADIKNAEVIFIDINGVAKKLFPTDEGLGLCHALRLKYHDKYLVIYSAETKGERFHQGFSDANARISKMAEPYEFINLLDNYLTKKNSE